MTSSATIAGKPILLDPEGKVERLFSSALRSMIWPSLDDGRENQDSPFVHPDFKRHHFELPYGKVPAPRVNEWIDPLGLSRYGRGMFLLDREAMKAVAGESFSSFSHLSGGPWVDPEMMEMPLVWGSSKNSVDLKIDYDNYSFENTVYPLVPLSVTGRTDLWLLPVVDARYQWLQESVRFGLGELTGKTWFELLELFANKIDQGFFEFTPDPRFGVPDPRAFAEKNVSPSIAIDSILLSLGYRAIVDRFGNIWRTEADEVLTEAYGLFLGPNVAVGGRSPAMAMPGNVIVSGPRAINYIDSGNWEKKQPVPGGSELIDPITVRTTHYEHNLTAVSSYDNESIESRDALCEVIAETFAKWSMADVISGGPYGMVVGSGSWPGGNQAAFDYVSTRIDSADSITTSAISLQSDFFPRVNYSQWKNNYIHLPSGSSWVFRAPTDGLPQGDKGEASITICQPYRIHEYGEITPAIDDAGERVHKVPVYNMSSEIEPGEFFLAHTVDGKAVVHCCGEGDSSSSDSSSSESSSSWYSSSESSSSESSSSDSSSHLSSSDSSSGKSSSGESSYSYGSSSSSDSSSSDSSSGESSSVSESSSSESSESNSSSSRSDSEPSDSGSQSSSSESDSSSASESSASESSSSESSASESSISESSGSESTSGSESESSTSKSSGSKSTSGSESDSEISSDSDDSHSRSHDSESQSDRSDSRSHDSESRSHDSESRSEKSRSDSEESESHSDHSGSSEQSRSYRSDESGSGSISHSDTSGSDDSIVDSGSDKSNAIVPASWSSTGYVAMYVSEEPEVVFNDKIIITMTGESCTVPLDPKYVELCEKGSIDICGAVPSLPFMVGASIDGADVNIVLDRPATSPLRIVCKLTAIRRGHAGKRLAEKTREQYIANERFINSAHPPDRGAQP